MKNGFIVVPFYLARADFEVLRLRLELGWGYDDERPHKCRHRSMCGLIIIITVSLFQIILSDLTSVLSAS